MGIEGLLDQISDWRALGVKRGKPGINVSKWLNKYRRGLTLHDSGKNGQPVKVDEKAITSIIQNIEQTPL